MSAEFDRLQQLVSAARRDYDAADRQLAAARYTLNHHERAAKTEWDKMNTDGARS